jgi:protein-tyrosine kinase
MITGEAMGKTYEALKRAEEKYRDNKPEAVPKPDTTPIAEPMTTPGLQVIRLVEGTQNKIDPNLPAEFGSFHEPLDCYEALKINMLAHHPGRNLKTILFIGTTHGDGASTTAINFATTLARNHRRKVLLIEANFRTPGIHEAFRIEREGGLSDIITNGDDPQSNIKRVDPDNLSVVTAGSKLSGPVNLFESDIFDTFLSSMRNLFDFIILDAPPVPNFSEALVLCAKLDGVVLVLRSGKTRKQVAVRAKKEIEGAGGNILGVVLNRRKFHIPPWIYKLL